MLLDCGPGVFAKLRRYVDYADVDAVVITPPARRPHPRPRAVRLRAALRAPRVRRRAGAAAADRAARARSRRSRACAAATGMTADHIELAFDVTIYDPADTLALGGLTVRFQPVPHFIPANAVEFAGDGARFTFSADCGPNEELCDVRRRHRPAADRGDAAAPERDGRARPPDARARPASTARGRGAKRVVLTHFSDELDVEWARAEGARGVRRAGRRGPRRRRRTSSRSKDRAASADPSGRDPSHRRHGWRATALAPAVSALQG